MDPMLLLLVVFAVMMIPMFLMSSRQRKRQRAQQEQISQLGIGDEVRTHSGFYGLIVEELGDTVVLESEDGSQLKWARAAISGKAEPTLAAEDTGADLDADADDRTLEDTTSTSSYDSSASSSSYDPDRNGIPGVTAPRDDRR